MNKPNSDSKPNTEGWNNINWRKAERYVFKLQKRIYAASRCGNVKLIRQLQKTLMRSWFNRVLSVRRVTQENQGKKTAGVDGVKSLSPVARLKLAGQIKLTGKSKPTRRVWIPKPGREEKRPLGIPTMHDRALQAVVKAALEPEWEAYFEPNSYGFRPGRSCHDAIKQIKNCIQQKAKFVLDADIAKCAEHKKTPIVRHIKVKGNYSPFNGDWAYWSARRGTHPETPTRVARLMKKQKGMCPYCNLYIRSEDLIEVDHIIPRSQGGKDIYSNLQLLHRHCHDIKTAMDIKSLVGSTHIKGQNTEEPDDAKVSRPVLKTSGSREGIA